MMQCSSIRYLKQDNITSAALGVHLTLFPLWLPYCLQLHHHHQIHEWAQERRRLMNEAKGSRKELTYVMEHIFCPCGSRGFNRHITNLLSSNPLYQILHRWVAAGLRTWVSHIWPSPTSHMATVGLSICRRRPQLHLNLYRYRLIDLRRAIADLDHVALLDAALVIWWL
jgi:hypothetical protein